MNSKKILKIRLALKNKNKFIKKCKNFLDVSKLIL